MQDAREKYVYMEGFVREHVQKLHSKRNFLLRPDPHAFFEMLAELMQVFKNSIDRHTYISFLTSKV